MLAAAQLTAERLSQERSALAAAACAALSGAPSRIRVRHELRYRGQSFELAVQEELEPDDGRAGMDPDALLAMFARAHEERYGYRDDSAEVELVNIRVSAFAAAPDLRPLAGGAGTAARAVRRVVFDGQPLSAAVLRGELSPGTRLAGPALCALPESTLLVPPGWSGSVDEHGNCHLSCV
jgi:N-methylhydantoinase A